MDGMLTITDAAARVGVSRQTIYNWIAAGKLGVIRVGHYPFVLLAAARACKREASPCQGEGGVANKVK